MEAIGRVKWEIALGINGIFYIVNSSSYNLGVKLPQLHEVTKDFPIFRL